MWTAADAYEQFMGRWSRRVATAFLESLDVPVGQRWLDVGCGVGGLTQTIAQQCTPSEVVGVDPSLEFLQQARRTTPPSSPVSYLRGVAADLPFPDARFDAAVSGLALNHVPDPAACLAELVRVTRAGGAVGSYVWDYDHPDFFLARFWEAAAMVCGRPADDDQRGRWLVCSQSGLAQLAERSRLVDPHVGRIRIATTFSSAEGLWAGFLHGLGPSGRWVTQLPQARQQQLHDRFVADLPSAPDGSVHLTAVALTMRGRLPSA